jgi:hypothetical protein
MSREHLDEMAGWISDCTGVDPDDLDDVQVQRYVQQHYSGGIDGFVSDQG